ncbi:MAG: LemA family protein [Cryomorphaceae bacterium BACL18 MAG-120924-bin36]|jgi:LemA protein|nr:MAG: LemA family protein [Cryomorphaceae bacterium BACL18 MAG-120924-bin36]KRP06159.1 MAG: LemA family protein [Cryomorphaceae bacterium BACL18 MAG-120507-bin74]MDP4742160.1 LemA family protein [Schleiferiaceae bacterium]MDP5014430.1 LemA family protein [Schleiferiaceae bacterium]HAG34331.1 LemA family protein [Cryomorphaceae bacterium]
MNRSTIILLSVLGGFVLILLWGVGAYNRLVGLSESTESQWANVQSAYQRRADLIPNLVSTVKGYADFEKSTLTDVIEARSKATSVQISADNLTPDKIAEFQKAQGELKGALSRLLVSVERYPDLKANQNFLALQSQLEGTENRINVERDRFNEQVRTYNSSVKRIPTSLVAAVGGFEARGYFEAEAEAQDAPEVSFE